MDLISDTFLGDPARWRWIAAYNNIEDPLRLAAGTVLEIPTLPPPGGTA
jgi:nucleoid-associated protein YgaU